MLVRIVLRSVVVISTLLLAVALSQAGVGLTPDLQTQRAAARLRLGVSATGGAVMVRPAGWVPGFGLNAEVGLTRNPDQVGRRGLLLGLEVAGGALVSELTALHGNPGIAPSFSSMLTVGYAWW